MKIRTGFVTNSSSYCSAEVVIDNPVLLEILKKYKDDTQVLRFFDLDDKVGFYEDKDGGQPFAENCPTKLEEVVPCIMDAINELRDYGDDDISEVLLSEIKEKRKEIERSFKSVEWQYSDDSYGEFDNMGSAKFSYCDGKETYEELEGSSDEEEE